MLAGTAFFASLGAVTDDGGDWLRRQCLILSEKWNTPVTVWLDMTLDELTDWIETNNALYEERRRKNPRR